MARGLDSATITALASDGFEMATLVTLSFGTPIRITDWPYNITYDSNTFVSSGNLLSIDDVKETAELRVNEIEINLSGADQTYISQFLNNDYIAVPASIQRLILLGGVAQGGAINAFTGQITGFEVEEDDGSSEVKVMVASHWKDFEKSEGRWTNPESQKRFFSSDDGFKFAKDAVREIYWGRR